MRLSARLVVSLVVAVLVVSIGFAMYDGNDQQRRMRDELSARATTLLESLEQASIPLIDQHATAQLEALADRFGNRERLSGVVIADAAQRTLAATSGLSDALQKQALALVDPNGIPSPGAVFVKGTPPMFITARPIVKAGERLGTLAIFYDTTYISESRWRIWRNVLLGILVQIAWIVPITALVVRFSLIGPLKRTTSWLRSIRTGQDPPPILPKREADLFQPLAREVSHLVNTLESVRAVAQEEARLRDAGEFLWTPERLRVHVRNRIQDRPLFVVSNREPYLHVKRNGGAEVLVPASGLVTALEPVLRACDGTWIAHGSADADRQFVDEHDRLRVPPEHPEYTLRRVWLTPEEESGYYFGFSNEGIWPLCHIAHTRPLFRASDWACYEEANQKFADAVIQEMEGQRGAIVLVQDYHLALLPRMIKKARPDARVAIFWHIPWPNPEAFGICPWQRELLDGLLGADLVGFHTQAHCNNFLETVERALESQVEWEHFTARRHDHLTHVKPFPISVAPRELPADTVERPAPTAQRAAVIKELGSSAVFLGIGVDRIDYTKGILERFRGVERFLERWESFQGEFTFVQIGAPSRTRIKRYEDLNVEVVAEAERINKRFQTATWKPIVLRLRHHDHKEIEPFYQTADVCLVTSLHDGMNLVAKEFVMARDDSDGVLVLSQFTGASRELADALIVNPYDTEQLADAIHRAIEMDPEERHARMRRMRQFVREHNVYRWAGTLIGDLSDIRVEVPIESVASTAAPSGDKWKVGRLVAPREPPHLFSQWSSLTPSLSRAESLAIFLDFDGTLAGIRRRPDDVHLSPIVCRLLSRLAGQGHLLGIVSGRSLDDLERKVGLPGLWYVGVHGFFLRAPDRKPVTFATRTERADIARATACLRRQLAGVRGIFIEPKVAAVAVHYRGARLDARAIAGDVVKRVVLEHRRLRLMSGNRVWEILPVDVVDKFNAVQRILRADRSETTTPRRVAIYVGDDVTDESVFRKFSGISVVVGARRPTRAKYALESPLEVRELLRRLELVATPQRQARGRRRARGPCIDAAEGL